MDNRLAKFEFAVIPRDQINEAAYNPRYMDDATAEHLRSIIEDDTIGLVEPLVFNKRTNTLVGGHQRLKQMDAILGKTNYDVPVALIDVDEATEKRINMILNNANVAGQWDVDKLDELFKSTDPFSSGFDVLDLRGMFAPEQVNGWIEKFYPLADEVGELPGTPDNANMTETEDEIAKIKAARKEHKLADRESVRSDHILVVVFDTAEQTAKAMSLLRLNPNDYFIFGPKFFAAAKDHAGTVLDYLNKQPVTNQDE